MEDMAPIRALVILGVLFAQYVVDPTDVSVRSKVGRCVAPDGLPSAKRKHLGGVIALASVEVLQKSYRLKAIPRSKPLRPTMSLPHRKSVLWSKLFKRLCELDPENETVG